MAGEMRHLESAVEKFKGTGYVSTQNFYFVKRDLEEIFGPLDQKERGTTFGEKHLYLPSTRRFSVSKNRIEKQRDTWGNYFYMIILDQSEP